VVLVFQEIRRGNGQHVAGDAAPDERRIGARIVVLWLSVLGAGNDHQIEIAIGTRSPSCPATEEIDSLGTRCLGQSRVDLRAAISITPAVPLCAFPRSSDSRNLAS